MESIMTKKWSLMAWLLLSWLSMANSFFFQDCYGTCFVVCAVTPGIAFMDCPTRCLNTCITQSTSSRNANAAHENFIPLSNTNVNGNVLAGQQQKNFFCDLGCAESLCTNISTKQNPAAKEVGSCVDSCIQTCIKN